jgi:hypothetical protein
MLRSCIPPLPRAEVPPLPLAGEGRGGGWGRLSEIGRLRSKLPRALTLPLSRKRERAIGRRAMIAKRWFLLFVVVIVALGALVALGVIPGTPGPNISDNRPH